LYITTTKHGWRRRSSNCNYYNNSRNIIINRARVALQGLLFCRGLCSIRIQHGQSIDKSISDQWNTVLWHRSNFWFPVKKFIFPTPGKCVYTTCTLGQMSHACLYICYLLCPDKNHRIVSEIVFRAIKHMATTLHTLFLPLPICTYNL